MEEPSYGRDRLDQQGGTEDTGGAGGLHPMIEGLQVRL
jgi:hypothetical protein